MGMKYVSAYLMSVLGGNDSPSAKDIKKIIEAGGLEFDSAIAEKLVSELAGKGGGRGREQENKSCKCQMFLLLLKLYWILFFHFLSFQ